VPENQSVCGATVGFRFSAAANPDRGFCMPPQTVVDDVKIFYLIQEPVLINKS
jgi:hypothetical protein